jgi:DNA-binding transcriptional LysR family regulator
MELRQLRYFVAVAESRHFGRAARGLRIAPPSLSQQIRVLERDLGVVLLHRDPREVTLTPAGAALLGHARALLARADLARHAVRSVVPGTTRIPLRVAPGVSAVLGAALRGLADLAPGVEVDVAPCPDADAVDAVRQERAGAAVLWDGAAGRVHDRDHDDAGLARIEVGRHPVVVLLAAGHRLAARAAVPAGALVDEEVLLPARDLAPALWDGVVARLGLDPAGVRSPADPAADGAGVLVREVVTGGGVALLPASLAPDAPGVQVRPIDPALDVALHLVWREPAGPALRRVLAAMVTG